MKICPSQMTNGGSKPKVHHWSDIKEMSYESI